MPKMSKNSNTKRDRLVRAVIFFYKSLMSKHPSVERCLLIQDLYKNKDKNLKFYIFKKSRKMR